MEFEHSEDYLSPHYQDGIGCESVTRQSGSGRPKSARTAQNIAAVGDTICSQEDHPDDPGTSKSSRQIAKTLGMSDRSVRRIAKMDLELSAFRRMPAQVLSRFC